MGIRRFKSSPPVSLLLLLGLLFAAASAARSPPDLVSDGVHNRNHDADGTSYLRLPFASVSTSSDTCDETYGFMPCTSTWIGNLFLILVYGFLMYTGATYLSNGSELLLEILGPGIVGGLFLPILGALPDALLILVSGLSGTKSTAQSQVSVGMGLLAGSTVMLLTVIWGSCVIVGKCDLQDSSAIDGVDTKGFSLTGSGVSTDSWTSYAAMIMAVSVIPFLVVQIPQAFASTSGRRLAVLISLILSLALLVVYCVYQIVQPWIQERRIQYVRHKRLILDFLGRLKMSGLGRLTDTDGNLNDDAVQRLFAAIDVDEDGFLVKSELRAFIIGVKLDGFKTNEDDLVEKVMRDFDVEQADSKISIDEFKNGISKWLRDLKDERLAFSEENQNMMKLLNDADQESARQHVLLGGESDNANAEKEGDGAIENPKKTTIKAILMLLLGTIIAAVFADPLVDAVDNFSDATSIPSFFISFIFLPLATNSSESVSAIIFSSRKKITTASLTFSELYGAATMNNVLCLAVFLALVYVRDLTWDFSAEVLVIVIVCIIIGLLGGLRTSFPLWTSFVAFALYPFSLLLVYVLDYICGWS